MSSKNNQIAVKSSSGLAKRTKKQKGEMWAGAKSLLEKPKNEGEQKERNIIVLTAKALQISPFGVNILGSVPYINKLGLAEKAAQYEKEITYEYRWQKYAQDDTDKAICECRIKKGNKALTDWVLGECSPATMKMGTLKGYQNHMAQTRAKNRATLELFQVKIHNELLENIGKMQQMNYINEKQAQLMQGAASVSVEEMDVPTRNDAKEVKGMSLDPIFSLAKEYGAKDGEEKKFIEDNLNMTLDWDNLTAKHISTIKTKLMAKFTK